MGQQQWPNHCPLAPKVADPFLLSLQIQQAELTQRPPPSFKRLVSCCYRPWPELRTNATLICQENLCTLPLLEIVMPALCPYTLGWETGISWPSFHGPPHSPPPMALLARWWELSYSLSLTTEQCLGEELCAPPMGTAAFSPRQPSSPKRSQLAVGLCYSPCLDRPVSLLDEGNRLPSLCASCPLLAPFLPYCVGTGQGHPIVAPSISTLSKICFALSQYMSQCPLFATELMVQVLPQKRRESHTDRKRKEMQNGSTFHNSAHMILHLRKSHFV